MNQSFNLKDLLMITGGTTDRRLALFALLSLGLLESLENGMVSATDAVRVFFNAENCQFVRQVLRDKIADEIMSHGVQLPDLFAVLPAEEAHREFQHELAAMRSLSLRLLEPHRMAA